LVVTDGEPTRLIDAWDSADLAVVVDAVRADPPRPGRINRFVVDRPGAASGRAASSHGLGFDDAIRLAVALDRMPGRLIVHAIEAADLARPDGTGRRRGGRRGPRGPGRPEQQLSPQAQAGAAAGKASGGDRGISVSADAGKNTFWRPSCQRTT
jgi:hypothetical protein